MYPLKARIEYCKNNKAIIEQAVIINEENTLRLKLPVEINISGMNYNEEMEFNPDEIRIEFIMETVQKKDIYNLFLKKLKEFKLWVKKIDNKSITYGFYWAKFNGENKLFTRNGNTIKAVIHWVGEDDQLMDIRDDVKEELLQEIENRRKQ